jgi:7-carboxy-7-deazaguanine synthase
MKINEIFYSLQGEGARAGEASIFLRLAGCDLACLFCDTEFNSGAEFSKEQVLSKIKGFQSNWIVWTGGEPTLQIDEEIVRYFSDAGYKQAIETNGNNSVPNGIDWVVVSPKVADHILKRNFPNGCDELRYAWHSGKEFVPNPSITAKHYYLSPICSGDKVVKKNLDHCIRLCLENPIWKLSVQQHKIWNIL